MSKEEWLMNEEWNDNSPLQELILTILKARKEADEKEVKYLNTIYFKGGDGSYLEFISDANIAEAMAEEDDWDYGTLSLWGVDGKEGVRIIPKENILFIGSKELNK